MFPVIPKFYRVFGHCPNFGKLFGESYGLAKSKFNSSVRSAMCGSQKNTTGA